MSRYIDPTWLYENVQEQAPQFAETLKNLILVAPSIDIVTCYMCKHSHMTYDGQCKYCDNITDDDGNVIEVYFDGSHFCSCGERKSK